jgi:DNA-binding NtrC family response regulator
MGPSGTNQEERGQPLWAAKGKALLVGGDPADLQDYCDIFESSGCRVRACNSCQEGVRWRGEEIFDFVKVIQGTPNFEGSCVLKRAIEIDHCLPIVIVARCLDMGC